MPAVDSSAIVRIGYREPARELDITFTSGKTYTYYGVPSDVYRVFLAADSKGRFFNEHVKDVYLYSRRGAR